MYFVNTLEKASIGEFADYERYLNLSKNIEENIPYLLAILSKKKVNDVLEKYGSYSVEERAAEFKSLSCITSMEIANFFLNNMFLSNQTTAIYGATRNQLEEKMNYLESLIKFGAGTRLLQRLRKKILQKYLRSQKQTLSNFLTSYHIK